MWFYEAQSSSKNNPHRCYCAYIDWILINILFPHLLFLFPCIWFLFISDYNLRISHTPHTIRLSKLCNVCKYIFTIPSTAAFHHSQHDACFNVGGNCATLSCMDKRYAYQTMTFLGTCSHLFNWRNYCKHYNMAPLCDMLSHSPVLKIFSKICIDYHNSNL